MWKLYDDLYIGIPSGIRITGCIVGEKWTCVSANGNVGIARTMGRPEEAEKFAAAYVGAYLRDTANYMKWDDLAKASVGVAALNAWYNTPARAEGLGGDAEPSVLPVKTACVGDCYESGDSVFPLPKAPDFDEAAYLKLKDYDTVVICANALTTRALPGLLRIVGEGGNVVLEGYSLPCTALFFAFGLPVRELRGYSTLSGDKLLSCARNAAADPAPGVRPFVIRPEKK